MNNETLEEINEHYWYLKKQKLEIANKSIIGVIIKAFLQETPEDVYQIGSCNVM